LVEPFVDEHTAHTIQRTLQESALNHRVVSFLLENEAAMDTVKGIATWWLGCDEVAAQACMDELLACRVICARPMIGCIYYGLTPDPDIRQFLRLTLSPAPSPGVASAIQPEVGPQPRR
jgi:hypothetical protein